MLEEDNAECEGRLPPRPLVASATALGYGPLYVRACFDKYQGALVIGLTHSVVCDKLLQATVSGATSNLNEEHFSTRVQLLYSKEMKRFTRSNPIEVEAVEGELDDPLDDDYDLHDPEYGAKILSNLLRTLEQRYEFLRELPEYTQLNHALQEGFSAVFCYADTNFGFPAQEVCPDFLHSRSCIEDLFARVPVKPEAIKRFLFSATPGAVAKSQGLFNPHKCEYEHSVAKGREASELFKQAYRDTVQFNQSFTAEVSKKGSRKKQRSSSKKSLIVPGVTDEMAELDMVFQSSLTPKSTSTDPSTFVRMQPGACANGLETYSQPVLEPISDLPNASICDWLSTCCSCFGPARQRVGLDELDESAAFPQTH